MVHVLTAEPYVTTGQGLALIGVVLLAALVVALGLAFSWHFYAGLFDWVRAKFGRQRPDGDVHRSL